MLFGNPEMNNVKKMRGLNQDYNPDRSIIMQSQM
jgi:hypothetical protein